MLTNFISEAANEMYYPVVEPATVDTVEAASDEPVIIRNSASESREAHVTDIYDRARVIYFRAKRTNRARAANIL